MELSEILPLLKNIFPESNYTAKTLEQFVESGELNLQEEFIINTLKGALLDESIIEVQLHGLIQIYFCRILDKPYDAAEKEDIDISENAHELEYEKGFYLDYHDYVITTPLEPSMGNYLISSPLCSNIPIVLKYISSSQTIELGCFFHSRTQIGDIPALKLTFPFVARKTKTDREFRAKVPKDMGFKVRIERANHAPITTAPLNISYSGMSLLDPGGRHSKLKVGDNLVCVLQIPKENDVLVDATIIHVSRLRDSKGTQYCFGVRFLFSKPTIQTAVEKTVGLVQRKYLQELSNYEEKFGVFYDK